MGQNRSYSSRSVNARHVALASAFALTGCSVPTPADVVQGTIFARPGVAYHSGDNIGVDYEADVIWAATNEREAIVLIEQYCKGQYRVTSRRGGHIDAECTH